MTALHVTAQAQEAARTIDTLLQVDRDVVVIIEPKTLAALVSEIGTIDQAVRVLQALVDRRDRPVVIKLNANRSGVIRPTQWSSAKADGWLGVHHAVIESHLGRISSVRRSR
jgi:hypothetical protein